MKRMFFVLMMLFIAISTLSISSGTAHANNLSISNVTISNRNPATDTVAVQFDLQWQNSWKTKINHDAVWVTIRLNNPTVSPTDKKLCTITSSGNNPAGTAPGSNSNLIVYVPSDKVGAFVKLTDYGKYSTVSSTDVQLTVDYSSCGFTDDDNVNATVFGLEMVYIPSGSYYAGDNAESSAALTQGSADNDPWYIQNGGSISVSDPSTNGYRYSSAGNAGEDTSGASFTISSEFPNGYEAFYVMKYEMTEGHWVDFINSLGSESARVNHDLTDGSHKGTDLVSYRNTISCSGSTLICSSQREVRPVSYISWMDLAAYLDWMGLRPMTELEFEKMARGPLLSKSGEFAWGTTNIVGAAAISGADEDGTETISTAQANAHYNNQVLTGGDSGSGADYEQGPIRCGIFATSSSSRENSGAGFYGVMELSGNVRERVVTIGNSEGRSFIGSHGDGVLSTVSGFEGYANQSDWPGMNVIPERGVTGSAGSGYRGGAWDDQSSGARLRTSDRVLAAYTSSAATNNSGGRGVRSDDEN